MADLLHAPVVFAGVVARDRYGAEDALERIEVEYRELDPVVDPVAAAAPGAPLLHREVGSNVVSDRRLRYGDPDAAFASAAHRVAISVRYPRNACTPIEGFVDVQLSTGLVPVCPACVMAPVRAMAIAHVFGDIGCELAAERFQTGLDALLGRNRSFGLSTRCLAAIARSDSPGFVFTPLPPGRPTRSALRSAGNP